jgi:hypothetical protein
MSMLRVILLYVETPHRIRKTLRDHSGSMLFGAYFPSARLEQSRWAADARASAVTFGES